MPFFSDIKGQKTAVKFLSNCLRKERARGSYLFTGPAGTGRALTAKAFIMALFCGVGQGPAEPCGQCPACVKTAKLEHPDICWVVPEKNKNIKIEEIRDICGKFCLKPYESNFNVCVLEEAHMMTTEASNAFLKMLEQPPPGALFVLITDKKELILPTVLSRCVEVRFSSLSAEDTKNIIISSGETDEKKAEFLAYFSQGSPGIALEIINEDMDQRKQEILKLIMSIVSDDDHACFNWDREGKDYLLEDIEMLIMFFRDIAMGKENLEKVMFDKSILDSEMHRFFEKCSVEKIFEIMERLINVKLALFGNANPKLAMQVLPNMLVGAVPSVRP